MDSATFNEQYKQLNDEQRLAVDTLEGPVLVVAGPGSGKTQLLSLRVAAILRQTDLSANNILCLTFTEAAATTMRTRMQQLIGPAAYQVAIHTFHSFGSEIIARHPEYFYQGATFVPANDLTRFEIVQELIRNLAHSNPLRAHHPSQGFTYTRDALQAISQLKKAGLSPKEYLQILAQNQQIIATLREDIHAAGSNPVSKTAIAHYEQLLHKLEGIEQEPAIPGFRSLAAVCRESLERALTDVEVTRSTKPLTAWKASWITKDETGTPILKEKKYQVHQETLAELYAKYQDTLYTRQLFDFDDMILQVLSALEQYPALKSELQEQYQYILVDEFQDTNDAQMRLLFQLGDAPVNEGRPNIMVVGDDDQAIYRFQGAELSNILDFRSTFRNPTIITLTKNYRSTQHILDLARTLITQGEDRLETREPAIRKLLVAANQELAPGAIVNHTFATQEQEFGWITATIKHLLTLGTTASEIAVIGRNHRELELLSRHFAHNAVAYQYERQQDVFKQAPIQQLLQICRYLVTLTEKTVDEADYLLPEILSYPFWELPRLVVWQLSEQASTHQSSWLSCLLNHESAKLREIGNLFLELAGRAKHEPLEYVLASFISSESYQESDDGESYAPVVATAFKPLPFARYYFSQDQQNTNLTQYLSFLSSLRTLIEAVQSRAEHATATLQDLVNLADLYEQSGVSLNSSSPGLLNQDAVHLLTAHAAKGREFAHVFLVSCQENVWMSRGRSSNLPFPHNLPLAPAGDSTDDQLRLLYVALTRAKHNLYLSAHEQDIKGRTLLRIPFLGHLPIDALPTDLPNQPSTALAQLLYEELYVPDTSQPNQAESNFLGSLLANYRLSPTHLTTYLDLTSGGPAAFLNRHLLRFPTFPLPQAAFGTSLHQTIRHTLTSSQERTLPTLASTKEYFSERLQKHRLSSSDQRIFLERGLLALDHLYSKLEALSQETFVCERNFGQGILIENVPLTGTIDLITFTGKEARVIDFKTGKAATDWEKGTSDQKMKLWRYRLQLIFYKLLLENSRDYGRRYRVSEGGILFIEPDSRGHLYELNLNFSEEEVTRTRKLITAVYTRILNLEFSQVEEYPATLEGIKAFEEGLVNGKW